MSGHIFFKDRYYGYDDAIYAGCRIIEIVAKHKRNNPDFKIQSLLQPFNCVYTSKELRFPCANCLKTATLENMKKSFEENPYIFEDKIVDIITLDGFRFVFDGGFALIRQSNTEPVFTLRFEGKTKEKCEQYKKTMVQLLEECKKKAEKETYGI